MSENGRKLVEQLHREAVARYREQQKERQQTGAVFHGAMEPGCAQPSPLCQPPTVPFTTLPEALPDSPLYEEWNCYRREVARLLADGQEGKFVLIHGPQVVGVYGTWDDARQAGLGLYLLKPFLVQKVCAAEPLLRIRGYSLPCPS
jgi:hypothetical protein